MTLSRQRAEEIFDKVLKYSTADETEAMVSSSSFALTRFANNIIHQNVAEETTTLSVRLVTDGRMARASTNKFDEASIRQLCEGALALARLQPPDPDLLRCPARRLTAPSTAFSRDGGVESRRSRRDCGERHQARGEGPPDRGGRLFQRRRRLRTL